MKHSPQNGNLPLIIYIPRKCPGLATVVDNEGHEYPVTRIGNQLWMAENLNTQHYNNGDEIIKNYPSGYPDSITKFQDWSSGSRFYTWDAIMDSRGVCPSGMHIPTITEFGTLINYVGGYEVGASKLQVGGYEWLWPSINASEPTNPYCFSAQSSGGCMYRDYPTSEMGWIEFFWSSTSTKKGSAKVLALHVYGWVHIYECPTDREHLVPARCVKNVEN